MSKANIKVNDDGTIGPIDPSKPSAYSTDFSEEGVIKAILLNMEWCHAVKTESLEKATKQISELINEARINELKDYQVEKVRLEKEYRANNKPSKASEN